MRTLVVTVFTKESPSQRLARRACWIDFKHGIGNLLLLLLTLLSLSLLHGIVVAVVLQRRERGEQKTIRPREPSEEKNEDARLQQKKNYEQDYEQMNAVDSELRATNRTPSTCLCDFEHRVGAFDVAQSARVAVFARAATAPGRSSSIVTTFEQEAKHARDSRHLSAVHKTTSTTKLCKRKKLKLKMMVSFEDAKATRDFRG